MIVEWPRMGAKFVALFVLALSLGTSSWGQSRSGKVALVIAESNYSSVPRLSNPPADAALIAAALRKAKFDSVEIVRDLDKAGLDAALHRFSDRAEGADVAMVYYAGHGIELGGQNYLVPVNARLLRDRDADFEAVSLTTVLRALDGARLKLVVLDACRDNPFAVSVVRAAGSGRSVGRGLARIEPETSDMLVAYAAKAGAIAADGSGSNSPFATALAQRIVEPGVEIRLMFGKVRDDVLRATSRAQEPFTYGSLSGEAFYLMPGQAVAAQPTNTGADERLLWQGALSANSAEGFRDYLSRYPTGYYATAARENLRRFNTSTASVATSGALAPAGVSMAAGNDFYAYANGAWLAKNPVPEGKASYGAFDVLNEINRQRTRDVIEAADPKGKLAALYASYLDQPAIEAKGMAPIAHWLSEVRALRRRDEYPALLGKAWQMGIAGPMTLQVLPNIAIPGRYALLISPGGLGLPSASYYSSQDAKLAAVRADYVAYLETMLGFAGVADAAGHARAIVAFESRMAAIHPPEGRMDPKAIKVRDLSELRLQAAGFDLAAWLQAAGVPQSNVAFGDIAPIAAEARILASADPSVLADQLVVRSLEAYSDALPDAVAAAEYAFYRVKLRGAPIRPPRWQRALSLVSDALPDEVGKLYVARYFPPEAKQSALDIVANLRSAMANRIETISWMGSSAKAEARRKLAALRFEIGYPDRWRDVSHLEIRKDDMFGNLERINRYRSLDEAAKLAGPVRDWEWDMAPNTVNAYADPSSLKVVFPAAMFQAPFFDAAGDKATNYGAIGATIGHELSHHFDDGGADYDVKGSVARWWNDGDTDSYRALADRLVRQYDDYQPLPETRVSGKLTLGENAGDLAGLTLAYDAWRLSLGGKVPATNDRVTEEQRFFLGWATIWRRNISETALRARLASDPHAPSEQRAAIARNLEGWYRAFDVNPGAALYLAPEDRVRIW